MRLHDVHVRDCKEMFNYYRAYFLSQRMDRKATKPNFQIFNLSLFSEVAHLVSFEELVMVPSVRACGNTHGPNLYIVTYLTTNRFIAKKLKLNVAQERLV